MKKHVIAVVLSIVSLAGSAAHAGQSKQTICHKTGSGWVEITVANPAVMNAHLNHGDTTGACPSGTTAPSVGVAVTPPVAFLVCSPHANYGVNAWVSAVGNAHSQRTHCDVD